MATKVVQPETISARLIGRWEQVAQKLLSLAEEVHENHFDYRPVSGVRTFAEVLRHVAFWNIFLADSARGKKANDTANELSKKEYSTKAQIVNVLRRSAADATEAFKEHLPSLSPEFAEMLVTFIEHNCEHYGQLVVYSRLNGIVPPVSRA
jgi:uncharacterized damage-inducible protein DinB